MRWRLILTLGLVLLAVGAGIWLDPTRTVLGRLSGEEFFAARPVSYWAGELTADPARKAAALKALAVPAAVPILRVLLQAPTQPESGEIRMIALDLLSDLGPDAHAAGDDLVALLQDPDPLLPAAAAAAIPKVGVPAAQAIPALLATLDGPAGVVATRAISTYKASALETLPALEKILADPSRSTELRWNAARTIGKIGPPAVTAVPVLVSMLHDPETTIREHSAEAIGDIGPAAAFAIPDLIPLLNDPNERVRRDTVRSLGYMGGAAKEYGPHIVRLLDDKSEIVREAAKVALKAAAPELVPQPAPKTPAPVPEPAPASSPITPASTPATPAIPGQP